MARIAKFLRALLYENGSPSRTGLAALILILLPLLAFLLLTGWLTKSGQTFEYYSSFSGSVEWLITTGCGLLGANKFINKKYTDGQSGQNQGDEKNENLC